MASSILIVDDSQTLRLSLRKIIEKIGFMVIEAKNGYEGLAVLKKNPGIRLVLIDYNMPDMNGIEMVSELKKQNSTPQANCVIITSIGNQSERLLQTAKEVGVIAWLTKPVESKQVENLIKKLGA